jgi:hypothetical protein
MTNEPERAKISVLGAKINLQLAAILVGGLGLIMLLVPFLKHDFLSSTGEDVVVGIGSGFLTSGIVALAFETLTHESNWLVLNAIQDQITEELQKQLTGDLGIQSILIGYMDRHSQELHNLLMEAVQDAFTPTVRKEALSSGIIGAHALWANTISESFLMSEKDLKILLKDGHDFFQNHAEGLKKRFQEKTLKTTILILHPEYKYIDAVAAMDPDKDPAKPGQKDKQKNDCLLAISTMKGIRKELLQIENEEIKTRVEFFGYHYIPTWTGFIGSKLAYIALYFTHPHRGPLNTLVIHKGTGKGHTYYESMFQEYSSIHREASENGAVSLFDYNET